MRIGLVGYGRMGRAVERVATGRGHEIAWIVDPDGPTRSSRRRLRGDWLSEAEVAVEFSVPSVAEANVLALLRAGIPTVCGTTGWDHGSRAVRRAAREAGVGAVLAANFSPGMNLFYRIVEHAATIVGAAALHDPYVFEAHHRGKADSPSGTALRLATIVADADPRRPEPRPEALDGRIGESEMHVVSLRVGWEPGRHIVGFDGEHDEIALSHRARSRSGFATGAILAAEWLHGRRGVHGFDRVLDDLLSSGGRRGGRE